MSRNLSRDGWSLDPRLISFGTGQDPIGWRLDGSVPEEIVPQLDRIDMRSSASVAIEAGRSTYEVSGGLDAAEEPALPHAQAISDWGTWARWAASVLLDVDEIALPERALEHQLPDAIAHRTTRGVCCRADFAGGAVPYLMILFLTNHTGGEGSLVVHDHRPPAIDDPTRPRILDPTGFGLVETVQIAALRSRSVLLRTDYAYQLLPTTNPCAFITMRILVGDDGTAISFG